MDYKRSYTRNDLEFEVDQGVTYQICKLCDGHSLPYGKTIIHNADCPMTDPDVLGVMLTALSKPRSAICEACPEDDCVTGDWHVCTHETLLKCCNRYAGRL